MKSLVMTPISNFKNPQSGKTYKEENMEKNHTIPLGTLVEIIGDISDKKGLRLWVVAHERDFDGTPLYALSFDKDWSPIMYGEPFKNTSRFRIDGGYTSEILKVI